MNTINQILWYLFVLSLVLVIVAYYVGFQTDVTTLSGAISNLFQLATGRNAQGVFAAYPSNSASSTGTTFTTAAKSPQGVASLPGVLS